MAIEQSEIISHSEEETAHLARTLATSAQAGDIFTLKGTLGMGKSVFARNFIQELAGAEIEVPSPTFTLVQTYETPKAPIWHFDLYRIEEPEEIYEIGWEEAVGQAILLIEWPERLGNILPNERTEIEFEMLGRGLRTITVNNYINE